MANLVSETLTFIGALLSSTRAAKKEIGNTLYEALLKQPGKGVLGVQESSTFKKFVNQRVQQALSAEAPAFSRKGIRDGTRIFAGAAVGAMAGLGASVISGDPGNLSTTMTVGATLGAFAGRRGGRIASLLEKALPKGEDIAQDFAKFSTNEEKIAAQQASQVTPPRQMADPAPSRAVMDDSPSNYSPAQKRAAQQFEEQEAEIRKPKPPPEKVDEATLYADDVENEGQKIADMKRQERTAPEKDPKKRKENKKAYKEAKREEQERRETTQQEEKTQKSTQRKTAAGETIEQEAETQTDYNELGQKANSIASPRQGMNKDFGPLSEKGRGLTHLADFAAAPAVGAAVGGVQGAMAYDNSKDQEFQGLKATGTAKAFTEGALKGAAVGAVGVAGIKSAQKVFAGPGGTKSLTSSFFQGLSVGDRVESQGWADSSQLGTRALSETANESGLRASLDTMEDATRQRTGLEEQITKAGSYTPDEARAFHSQTTEDISGMSRSESNQRFRDMPAADRTQYQQGGQLNLLDNKVQQSANDFVNYNTGADLNQSRPGKAISEIPNLGAFYGGQAVAGIQKSISATKSFYRENVAPEAKAESSSFFRRRNPNYLNMADETEASILNVPQHHGAAMSGFKSGMSAAGGAAVFAGAAGVAAYTGAMSSATNGGLDHPANVLTGARDKYMSAQAQMQADSSERVRMTNPGAIGLNDIEENYFTNPSMSPTRGRHRPGKYNDTGNLTLALSALRRG